MHERLSFYAHRDSYLHRLNPLTKLTLVLGLTLVSFTAPWYWTPHLLIIFVILPLSFVGSVIREYMKAALGFILPAAGFLFIMQALFNPGGETILFHFWFLTITEENLFFAFGNAARIIMMV